METSKVHCVFQQKREPTHNASSRQIRLRPDGVAKREGGASRSSRSDRMVAMMRKVSVVIEQDEHGCYAWCPELKGCQSQGATVEETLVNIREAAELFLETLTEEERLTSPQQVVLTTSIEVHA